VASGVGLFRNDDENDGHDLTPQGSSYDSQEWVFIDYRASIAARHMGQHDYADALQDWVRDQSLINYLLIGENYDPVSRVYTNNAPMIGFGAGSVLTAARQREGEWSVDPACGAYFDETTLEPDPSLEPVLDGAEQEADAGSDLAEDRDQAQDEDQDRRRDEGQDQGQDQDQDQDGVDTEPEPDADPVAQEPIYNGTCTDPNGEADGCCCRVASPAHETSLWGLLAVVAMGIARRRRTGRPVCP